MGRSRKQKVELGGSAVTERLTVDGRSFSYQQLEGSFSQPNAGEDKVKFSPEYASFACCARECQPMCHPTWYKGGLMG